MAETYIVPSSSPLLKEIAGSLDKGTPVNEFAQDAAVISGVDTDLVSYTVPAGKTLYIQGFKGTGTATARYTLKIGGTTKWILRTSAANRSESENFADGVLSASAGTVVKITGYHEETPNQTLQALLFGFNK